MLTPSVRVLERLVWFLRICLASICALYNIMCVCVSAVSPVIALSPAEVSVIEEQQVTLPCVLLAGNPLPVRHWLHENTLVRLNSGTTCFERIEQRALCRFFSTEMVCNVSCAHVWQVTSGPYVSIRRDGSLHIERVGVQDEGQYTCVAENVAGASNRTTTIHVYGKMGLWVSSH